MDFQAFRNILGAAVLTTFSATALAAVSIDENGYGFVGKGDVQALFDWNNAQLQANAASLTFRFASSETVSWKCEGINKAGHVVVGNHERTTAVNAEVALDPRKNKQGQITGFNLQGLDQAETAFQQVGTCGKSVGFEVPFALIQESIQWQGNGEPSLQVSVDGEVWYDLQITY